jgi:hypothetical protein
VSVLDEYTLSPGAVASMTEPTPDLQRNYRQRGMLESYGKADDSGRWKYSLRDLVGFWIADRLAQRGYSMDRRDALRHGYALAPGVIDNVLRIRRGGRPSGNRFSGFLHDGWAEGGRVHGILAESFSSLADIESRTFDRVEMIDTHHLARTIPAEIQGLLIAAFENEANGA